MTVNITTARDHIYELVRKVNADADIVEITSKDGDAVLMSKETYEALEETAYLLRSPANAAHLIESLAQARRGETEEHDL